MLRSIFLGIFLLPLCSWSAVTVQCYVSRGDGAPRATSVTFYSAEELNEIGGSKRRPTGNDYAKISGRLYKIDRYLNTRSEFTMSDFKRLFTSYDYVEAGDDYTTYRISEIKKK